MNTDLIKLREETGAGVMECSKALEDAKGDIEGAKKLIFERGFAKAEKRAQKKTGSGTLATYVHASKIGAMIEVRCETDFVAKNDVFQSLAKELAMQIASMNPSDVSDLLEQPYIKDESMKVSDLVSQAIAKTGENIKVERFCRYEL